MNPKKKQEPSKLTGERFEAFDDIEDEEVVWEDDASGDPAERSSRKAKGKGRDSRSGPRRRSFDDDSVDGG